MNNRAYHGIGKKDQNLIIADGMNHTSCKRVTYNNKRRQIIIKKDFFVFMTCFIMIFITGCRDPLKVALETDSWADHEAAEEALEKLTDQVALTKVAFEAKLSEIREAAVSKLTDQTTLVKIALEDKDQSVRSAAVKMLTDQHVLIKIAAEDEDTWVCRDAIDRIDTSVLARVIREKDDRMILLIYKTIHAFDSVPYEDRERLINRILPEIRVFCDPEIADVAGEIAAISTTWSHTEVTYSLYADETKQTYNGTKTKAGECFSCTIKFKKWNNPVEQTWCTQFPFETDNFSFSTADVNAGDLWKNVLERLSQNSLVQLGLHGKYFSFSLDAVRKLTDQALLAKIALGSENRDIRQNVIDSITDHSVLEKIALQDKDGYIRINAAIKINDQTTIAKIVIEEKELNLRTYAIDRLTNKELIKRIASEDKDKYIRKYASLRLESLNSEPSE